MDIEEILAPIEFLWIPGNLGPILAAHGLVDGARVVAPEDVAIVPDEGQKKLDQGHHRARLLFYRGQLVTGALQQRRDLGGSPGGFCFLNNLLEEPGSL